jgi:phosphate-selective porin OprO and OprP
MPSTSILCRRGRALLMASSALLLSPPAVAQGPADETAALRAEVAALRAQMEALQARLDKMAVAPANPPPAAPPVLVAAPAPPAAPPIQLAWKGGPELSDGKGWSFKPRGRIHLDVGSIRSPGALINASLGYNARVRRIRLGAEGTMPGGFGYKVEVDFANAQAAFGDAFLSYEPAKNLQLRIGNFESLNGLEQITSSNNISLLERAAFNDAFLNARRLGVALAWRQPDSGLRLEAALFAAHGIDATLDNDGWIAAGRATYAPKLGAGQLHLGATIQHREFSSNANGLPAAGASQPSSGQLARYRARPNSQLTDVRFVDTGSFAASGDQIIGLEAAYIRPGPYLTAEAQWVRTRGWRPGSIVTGQEIFGGGASNSAVTTASNPGFFGGYAELGWFITGETRGYSGSSAAWSRTKVLSPVSKGGPGAFQLLGRVEHVDLDDDRLQAALTNDFTTGVTSLASLNSRLGRGGTQTSWLIGLNWLPLDYVRFMLNYGRVNVRGGPLAAQVLPGSSMPVEDRRYGVDVLAARMQFEF